MIFCLDEYEYAYADQPQAVDDQTIPHGFPLKAKKDSEKKHIRVRRAGIYEECCKNSCSHNELRSYCGV